MKQAAARPGGRGTRRSVLDLGAGTGTLAIQLKQRCPQAQGHRARCGPGRARAGPPQGRAARHPRSTSSRGCRPRCRSRPSPSTSSSRPSSSTTSPARQARDAGRGATGAEARRPAARRRLGQARRSADGRAVPLGAGLRRLRGDRGERCAGRCPRCSRRPVSRTRGSAGGSGRRSARSRSTAPESRADGLGRARLLRRCIWRSRSALRSALQLRRTGSTGFKGVSGSPGSLEWFAGVLFVRRLDRSGALAAVLDLTEVLRADRSCSMGRAPTRSAWCLFALGLAATLYASSRWASRGGSASTQSERTDLVTEGPFAVVRNPIFAAMIPTSLGLTLLVPNVVALIGFAALVLALEIQVRLVEEPYLRKAHGQAYARYAARTGRFAPGLGRMGHRSESALDSPRDEAGESCRAPCAAACGGRARAPQAERPGRRRRPGRPRALVPAPGRCARHGAADAHLRPLRAGAVAGVAGPRRARAAAVVPAPCGWSQPPRLLSTFALQEWIEGWITPGHPGDGLARAGPHRLARPRARDRARER